MPRPRVAPQRAFLLVYGAAHGAKSLIWHASEFLFAFFLTEAIGLSPAYVGLMLGLSLVLNALMDLCVGWTLRRWVSNSLRASRLQLLGAWISAAMLLTFAFTGQLPPGLRADVALTSLLAFRLAYPFYDNPQNTLLAFATRDDSGRARLTAARYVAGGAARLLLAASFAPMMIGQPAAIQSKRFGVLCLAMALAAVVTAGGLQTFVRRWPHIELHGERRNLQAGARGGETAPLIALLAIAFTLSISGSLFGRLEPYFAAFAVRHVINAGVIMLAATVGSLLSQWIWARAAHYLALANLLRVALVVLAAGAGLFYVLAPLGVAWSAAACLVYGIGSGGVHMSLWSLLAGRASALTGAFTGTAAFGLFTCFSKLGLAFAATAMGIILAGVDYHDQILAMGPVFAAMAAAPVAGALVIGLLTVSFRARAQGLSQPRGAWLH